MLTLAVPAREPGASGAAETVRRAARSGADLLLLPLHAEGPAEPCDGPLADRVGAWAEAASIAILFSYAEACSGNTHFALQLVQADGRATANCRAAHLSAAAVAAGSSPGNWLTIARHGELRVGLMAGLDPLAPEVGRALSALGAELLVGALVYWPASAGVACPGEALRALATVRALENAAAVCLFGAPGVAAMATADGRLVEPVARDGLHLLRLPDGVRHDAVPRSPALYRRLLMVTEQVVE